MSTNVLTGYSDLFNASGVYAIGGGVPISQPDAQGDLVIPSYQDLFGSQSFCECMHCSSVYGPAAYFADLLGFLRQSLVTKRIGGTDYVQIVKNGVPVNKTGLDVLFERRPDLGDIRLDCANTNTRSALYRSGQRDLRTGSRRGNRQQPVSDQLDPAGAQGQSRAYSQWRLRCPG